MRFLKRGIRACAALLKLGHDFYVHKHGKMDTKIPGCLSPFECSEYELIVFHN